MFDTIEQDAHIGCTTPSFTIGFGRSKSSPMTF